MPFSFSSESGAGGGEADAAARSEAEDAARLAQLERQRQEEQRRQIQDCKLNFRYFRLCSKKHLSPSPTPNIRNCLALQSQKLWMKITHRELKSA